MKSLFSAMTLWIMACALVRLSIAISLLRLSTDRIWRGSLWTIITAQIVLYIVFMVFHLFGCRPLRASWEPVWDMRCWPRHHVRDFGYTSSGMFMAPIVHTRLIEAGLLTAIDFILAFMPIHLIRGLNRRTSEKILICFMMSLGLMAGVIASYKISISDKTFRGDLMSGTVILAMWNELEALLGIVAACVPCLKAPGERLLHRVGLLATRAEMTRPSFVISLQDHNSPHTANGSGPSYSLPSSGGSGKGSDLDRSNTVTVEVDSSVA